MQVLPRHTPLPRLPELRKGERTRPVRQGVHTGAGRAARRNDLQFRRTAAASDHKQSEEEGRLANRTVGRVQRGRSEEVRRTQTEMDHSAGSGVTRDSAAAEDLVALPDGAHVQEFERCADVRGDHPADVPAGERDRVSGHEGALAESGERRDRRGREESQSELGTAARAGQAADQQTQGATGRLVQEHKKSRESARIECPRDHRLDAGRHWSLALLAMSCTPIFHVWS